MTDKEIRHIAGRRLAKNSGNCVSLMVFMFSVISFLALCEAIMYLVLRDSSYSYLYETSMMLKKRSVMVFWLTKTLLEIAIMTPVTLLIRRFFIDISRNTNMTDTRQYITAHSAKYYSKAFYSSFIHNLIKFFAAVPGLISAYGVYYWSDALKTQTVTSPALFFLTLCLSFTGAWIGLTGHYYISLALTPYIMALNPRTNIFDACDLSVKLMDGKHGRYLRFTGKFILLLPLVLLVYPVFVLYPYYKICYTLLIDELLGDFKQDKMPGMIKRWRKYL